MTAISGTQKRKAKKYIGRTDREQIRSRINNNDCRTFRPRRPLSTAYKTVLYAVDKGLRGRNVLQSLLLILLRICSRSVRPILTSSNEPLQHQKSTCCTQTNAKTNTQNGDVNTSHVSWCTLKHVMSSTCSPTWLPGNHTAPATPPAPQLTVHKCTHNHLHCCYCWKPFGSLSTQLTRTKLVGPRQWINEGSLMTL